VGCRRCQGQGQRQQERLCTVELLCCCAAAYSGYRVRIYLIHALPRAAAKGGLHPEQVETLLCVGGMAACIIALVPPLYLATFWRRASKKVSRERRDGPHMPVTHPCIACLLAKNLTASPRACSTNLHALWCPAATDSRCCDAPHGQGATTISIGQPARCSETLVKVR
jgi:hypothetical protein